MDWTKGKFKSNWKMNKERIIFLFCAGLLLFILSIPNGGKSKNTGQQAEPGRSGVEFSGGTAGKSAGNDESGGDNGATPVGNQSPVRSGTYEEQMEERVREILSHVEGVGEVDVMIVLKSSEEKVLHVDRNTSSSLTEEEESGGGKRKISEQQLSENTVTEGGNVDGGAPVVEKEIRPEISGIVISADGGGSEVIKAEISDAMEALFGLPTHKIKVLKRVKIN